MKFKSLFDVESSGPFGLLYSQYKEYQADSFAINKLKSQKNIQGLYEGVAYFRPKNPYQYYDNVSFITPHTTIGTHPSLTSRIKRLEDAMKE